MGSPKETKNSMRISSTEKDIIIGTILGDGYLQKTGEKNSRLRLEHGVGQKEYLFWKVNKLNRFFQGKPKYLERMHPVTKRMYKYWRHQSQSMPFLGKLRKIFYEDGKKIIPENISKFLTPLSIAVWYMDDGYYYPRDKCSYIYLGNVARLEAERVVNALHSKFGLNARALAKKKGFALYFSPQETLKLKSILEDYILSHLKYKLPS